MDLVRRLSSFYCSDNLSSSSFTFTGDMVPILTREPCNQNVLSCQRIAKGTALFMKEVDNFSLKIMESTVQFVELLTGH
jgi:hypothetical protein